MSKRNKRKRRESFNKNQQDFFKKWDRYFGEYNKGEAGTKWARNKTVDLLATDTPYEQRLYLLDWFENLMRKFKPHACWVLECGLIYSIDKANAKIYYFDNHPTINRRLQSLHPREWVIRMDKLLTDKLDENDEWSRGGHTSYFHAGNLFFLSHLGYEVEQLNIAPGWWTNSGVEEIRTKHGHSFDVAELVTDINEYREKEVNRIAKRLWNIIKGKYPGEKIHDAIVYTDSNGIKWQKEDEKQ